MNTFVVLIFALLAVSNALPRPETLTYQDENGNTITEDLSQPMPTPYAVAISNLDFMLYTRASPSEPCKLTLGVASSLSGCGFNPKLDTKILVHGWQNNYDTESVQIIKDAYLTHLNVNVLIFGYKKYNSPYLSAVSSAKSVGESLGQFVQFLVQEGYVKLANLHIIGHSLGAHISGFCAQSVNSGNNKIGRITGLDPAGPLYGNAKPDGRLSSDDANYVDILHTSTSFGLADSLGDADFFPNGGTKQPECTHALSSDGCDHAASYRYFSQSIAAPNKFSTLKCSTLKEAQDKDKAPSVCSANQAKMGETAAATSASGFYFVPV